MPEFTEEYLAEVEARYNATTRSPWKFQDVSDEVFYIADADGCDIFDGDRVMLNAPFVEHAQEDVPTLLAEVRRLRAEEESSDQSMDQVLKERDRYEDLLDEFAYSIAPMEVIGEHSNMNCPWRNAMELLTSAAEVNALRAENEKLRGELRKARDIVGQYAYKSGGVQEVLDAKAALTRR